MRVFGIFRFIWSICLKFFFLDYKKFLGRGGRKNIRVGNMKNIKKIRFLIYYNYSLYEFID